MADEDRDPGLGSPPGGPGSIAGQNAAPGRDAKGVGGGLPPNDSDLIPTHAAGKSAVGTPGGTTGAAGTGPGTESGSGMSGGPTNDAAAGGGTTDDGRGLPNARNGGEAPGT